MSSGILVGEFAEKLEEQRGIATLQEEQHLLAGSTIAPRS